jgi:hypothetical protein
MTTLLLSRGYRSDRFKRSILIEGLQGLREKLNNEGDHLHRQIAQYAAFSQSVIDLTKIVSDGMASVNKSSGV